MHISALLAQLQSFAWFDPTIHAAEFFAVIGVAWKGMKAINKLDARLADFPLHRHVNGHIIYPKGQEPAEESDYQ